MRPRRERADRVKKQEAAAFIERLRELQSTLSKGRRAYHQSLYVGIQECAISARRISPRAWAAFCEEGFWQSQRWRPSKRRPSDQDERCRFVLRFAFKSKNRTLTGKRALVVRHLVDDGVELNAIAAEIRKRGGIECILKAARAKSEGKEHTPTPTLAQLLKADKNVLRALGELKSDTWFDVRIKRVNNGTFSAKLVKARA